jgi:predicted TIM-barrel fold metal-dependent hydrolase
MNEAIDAHVHVWTDDRERYPRTGPQLDYLSERFTPEDFLAHGRPHGVQRAVLVQMSFYGFDNTYMLDSMEARPGVFSGIAIINSESARPDRAMTELARRGVRGFRIRPELRSRMGLESAGMAGMWQCAAEHRLAICPLIDPDAIPVLEKMCGRFPDTPVVIDHLARIGMDGEIHKADVRALCGLAAHPNVYVKVSAFYALGRKQAPHDDLLPLVRLVWEAYGARRLMWGSDCPFQVQDGHKYADSIEFIRQRAVFLSEDDRSWMLSKTAESLFFAQ